MNILQLATSFPPAYAYGGPVESSYNISKNLVDRGHEVSVFTTDVNDAHSRLKGYEYPELMDGIRVHRFRNLSNKLAWYANISSAVGMWWGLRQWINDFDIVHLHEFRSFEAAVTSFEARKHGIPVVLQPRGSLPRTTKNVQKKVFDELIGESIVTSSDLIIASSEFESDRYAEVFPQISQKQLAHIPNGISRGDFFNLPEEGLLRDQYDIPKASELILFLGRLHPIKGIDRLVRAFSELDQSPDPYLVVIGPDDGHLEKLQDMKSALECDEIIFPGPMYGDDKLAAYVDADVFVLPSRYESFGNVAIEAMACGTPVVITETCGVAEWLDHESCRTVSRSPYDISKGISEVLSGTHSREAVRQYIWDNFTWEAVTEQIEGLYCEVVR